MSFGRADAKIRTEISLCQRSPDNSRKRERDTLPAGMVPAVGKVIRPPLPSSVTSATDLCAPTHARRSALITRSHTRSSISAVKLVLFDGGGGGCLPTRRVHHALEPYRSRSHLLLHTFCITELSQPGPIPTRASHSCCGPI